MAAFIAIINCNGELGGWGVKGAAGVGLGPPALGCEGGDDPSLCSASPPPIHLSIAVGKLRHSHNGGHWEVGGALGLRPPPR